MLERGGKVQEMFGSTQGNTDCLSQTPLVASFVSPGSFASRASLFA